MATLFTFAFADFLFRVIVKVPFYIIMSALSLLQLQHILRFINDVASGNGPRNQIVEFVRPALKQIAPILKESFGPLSKFSFQLTHVILVALILAVFSLAAKIQQPAAPPAPFTEEPKERTERKRRTPEATKEE